MSIILIHCFFLFFTHRNKWNKMRVWQTQWKSSLLSTLSRVRSIFNPYFTFASVVAMMPVVVVASMLLYAAVVVYFAPTFVNGFYYNLLWEANNISASREKCSQRNFFSTRYCYYLVQKQCVCIFVIVSIIFRFVPSLYSSAPRVVCIILRVIC